MKRPNTKLILAWIACVGFIALAAAAVDQPRIRAGTVIPLARIICDGCATLLVLPVGLLTFVGASRWFLLAAGAIVWGAGLVSLLISGNRIGARSSWALLAIITALSGVGLLVFSVIGCPGGGM